MSLCVNACSGPCGEVEAHSSLFKLGLALVTYLTECKSDILGAHS